jgi:hypothetical protein
VIKRRLLPTALLALLLLIPSLTCAAEDPALPPHWPLPPVTAHPNLLFTAADAPAIRSRLSKEFGGIEKIGDRNLAVFFTGDEAAKRQATADFVVYWKKYSERWQKDNLEDHPEWIDGVALRGVRRSLLLYDVVASYGYLTPAQTREFRDGLVRAIEFAIGHDAAHPRITTSDKFRTMNIWTDIVAAAGLTGLAFPELPQSRPWIEFAVREINRQLAQYVWDGCWHESPRYHAAMLEIVGVFFEVLERRTGVNLFVHPQFQAMLDWLVRFQTPLDRAAGPSLGHPEGVALLPGIGDSSWVAHSFGVAAMFAPHYVKSHPRLAGRIMWTWQRAGRPWEGDSVEWARLLIDPAIPAVPSVLGSDLSAGKGYVVMRSGFATPDEIWFLLRCGNASRSGSHDNADWNAFNLYAFGAPLALDSAAGAYSDPRHKAWHDKAVAHNTVVFGDRSQERKDGKILTWITRPELDYSVSDASVPAGVKKFIRHVLFVKPAYFVIWDEIVSTESAAWMLHTPATQFEWSEHRVRCVSPWQADLDVQVVWPQTPLQPGTKKGKYSDWKEDQQQRDPHPFQYQDYFGIPNAPGRDFLVVLHPVKPGAPALTVRDVGHAGQPALEITDGTRTDRIELHPDSADVRLGRSDPIHLTGKL